MNSFSAIDLSRLPAPKIVEALDYEAIRAAIIADIAARQPDLAPVLALESEPLVIAVEAFAYREMLLRARVNDGAKAVMLALATGTDLDQLCAFYGVERLIVVPADPSVNPPIVQVMESDDRLRRRAQLAMEGFSTAGPVGAYLFHTLSTDANIVDASVISPTPLNITVTLLANTANGAADQAMRDKVAAALNAEDVRPMGDVVTVNSAEIINYAVTASLILYDGPDGAAVLAEAKARLDRYVADRRRLGHDIQRNAIIAALFAPGVQDVVLTNPPASIEIGWTQAGNCTGKNVSIGGRDV